MNQEDKDEGVLAVLIKRFAHERYPKMLELKQNVDDGAVLNDRDISYLEGVLSDAHQALDVLSRHPEYSSLAQKSLVMYEEIMSKSQENNNAS